MHDVIATALDTTAPGLKLLHVHDVGAIGGRGDQPCLQRRGHAAHRRAAGEMQHQLLRGLTDH